MASIYGITLIAWGFGGIIGPQIIAFMKDNYPDNAATLSYYIALALLSLGLINSLLLKQKAVNQ